VPREPQRARSGARKRATLVRQGRTRARQGLRRPGSRSLRHEGAEPSLDHVELSFDELPEGIGVNPEVLVDDLVPEPDEVSPRNLGMSATQRLRDATGRFS